MFLFIKLYILNLTVLAAITQIAEAEAINGLAGMFEKGGVLGLLFGMLYYQTKRNEKEYSKHLAEKKEMQQLYTSLLKEKDAELTLYRNKLFNLTDNK